VTDDSDDARPPIRLHAVPRPGKPGKPVLVARGWLVGGERSISFDLERKKGRFEGVEALILSTGEVVTTGKDGTHFLTAWDGRGQAKPPWDRHQLYEPGAKKGDSK